jgi:hypothetical protein
MACCVIGAAMTAAVVWIARVVRTRVLRREQGTDAAAWRLPVSISDSPSEARWEISNALRRR